MRSVYVVLFVLVLFRTAVAQSPEPIKIGTVEISGSLRIRAEAWDWFDTSLANGEYGFGASVLRVSARQQKRTFDWQLELEQPTIFGAPNDAIAPAPQGALGLGANYFTSNGQNTASIFPRQALIRFKAIGGEHNELTLGRFEFIDGAETAPKNATLAALKRDRIAHRLIGNFGFSHVGRSFDGAQFATKVGSNAINFMAGRATRGVFNTDGLGELDVDVLYAALTRPTTKSYSGEWRAFAIGYRDGRTGVLKSDNRPAAARALDHHNIRLGTFGGNLIQTFASSAHGAADFLLWGALQTGQWGTLTQHSAAGAIEAGYHWNARVKPWLRAGYSRSTGDENPADRTHGTFFQMLPTPRIYARFPFFNLMNNEDTFVEFMLTPATKLSVRTDLHNLNLSSANDLWYSGGGAYEKSSFGYSGRTSKGSSGLANLWDVSADYQFTKQLCMTAYFAVAAGQNVVRNIYPDGQTGRFGYLEMNWKF
jgi:hypothetical protein